MRLPPLVPRTERRRFDWLDLFLLTFATLACLVFVANLRTHGIIAVLTTGSLIAGIAALWAFRRHATHQHDPIISLGVFASRPFAMGTLVSLTYGFGLYGSTYLIPVFLQNVLRYYRRPGAFRADARPRGRALAQSAMPVMVWTPSRGCSQALRQSHPPEPVC